MGLADGENMERLWSYLGCFCSMSKEMSAANRTDLLSDALHHYCTLKESKLGNILCGVVWWWCRHCGLYGHDWREVSDSVRGDV